MSNEREILDPTPQCGDDGSNGLDPVIVIVRSSLDPIAYLSRIPSPSSFLGLSSMGEIGIETLSADFCSGHEERSAPGLNGREIALSGMRGERVEGRPAKKRTEN